MFVEMQEGAAAAIEDAARVFLERRLACAVRAGPVRAGRARWDPHASCRNWIGIWQKGQVHDMRCRLRRGRSRAAGQSDGEHGAGRRHCRRAGPARWRGATPASDANRMSGRRRRRSPSAAHAARASRCRTRGRRDCACAASRERRPRAIELAMGLIDEAPDRARRAAARTGATAAVDSRGPGRGTPRSRSRMSIASSRRSEAPKRASLARRGPRRSARRRPRTTTRSRHARPSATA